MVASAKSDEERNALEAFSAAMAPYLNEPMRLRSLLSKIQARFISPDVQSQIDTQAFGSLDDLIALLPADVNVRVEANA
jgi:hypothetical protein